MKKILKNWTLPVAMATGTVLYLLFAYTPALEGAALLFDPFFDAIFPLFMFLILFVTFCKVDFRSLRPVAWHFWVALFQVFFSFLLVALILAFRVNGSGLVLMESALCCIIGPCAAAAAVVTQKLGGNLEQMTTYTLLSNVITAMLVPVCFPLIDKAADITFAAAFLKILREVCLVLLLPMLLAYIVKHHFHQFHRRIVSVRDLSYYLWAVSLSIVTGTTVKHICHASAPVIYLILIALVCLAICVVQFAVGRFTGHFFGSTLESGQALGQKNTAFAIWIAYSYLNPLSSVGPGCYILWQNIINSIEIWIYRRRSEQKIAPTPPQNSHHDNS